jgi:hypothetical protein
MNAETLIYDLNVTQIILGAVLIVVVVVLAILYILDENKWR